MPKIVPEIDYTVCKRNFLRIENQKSLVAIYCIVYRFLPLNKILKNSHNIVN